MSSSHTRASTQAPWTQPRVPDAERSTQHASSGVTNARRHRTTANTTLQLLLYCLLLLVLLLNVCTRREYRGVV